MGSLKLIEIFNILFIHFIGDFIVQTHYQSVNKSKRFTVLITHTLTYTCTFLAAMLISFVGYFLFFSHSETKHWKLNDAIFWFFPITFLLHTLTDFFTSKLSAYLKKNQKVYGFVIGIEQYLHVVQLLTTYCLLK